jgi:diguanylate cyclase (GGDEF)-like protein/PAS domain S-box-containing protein
MTIEQTERENTSKIKFKIPNLTQRQRALVGILIFVLYCLLIWNLFPVMGKSVIVLTMIPITGFIMLFGFWGSILSNLSTFLVFLLLLFYRAADNNSDIVNLIDIIYILVLFLVASLIVKQKEFIQHLYHQVTRQKVAEKKLIHSSEGYRNLINRVPVGLYRTTPDGKILEASPAIIEILGFQDFESLADVNISDELYVNPDDRLLELALLQDEGVVRDYEMKLYRQDGNIIWVRDNVRAIEDDGGNIICFEGSIEDITERKRVEAAEHEQRMLAEALRNTAAALSSTLEFDELLDRILTNMEHVVPHDAANIMLVEDGLARIERSKGYLYDWDTESRSASRFPIDEILTLKHMNETGCPLAIPDTRKSDMWTELPHTEWMRSYAGAPIMSKGNNIGFLNINSATPGFLTSTKAEWLKAFADQAAVAIENARMFGEIQEHARQTALLNEITQTTLVAPNLKDMIQILADHLGELISADGAFITMWDEQENKVIPGAAYGQLKDTYFEWELDSKEESITSLVLSKGEPLITDNDSKKSSNIGKLSRLWSPGSLLALPLIVDRKKLGAVMITYDVPHHFSQDEISITKQAARIIALAIYKAKLFDSERERTEELARANTLITALGIVATQVELAKDPDVMIEILCDGLIDLGFNSLVMLQDKEGQAYKVHHIAESSIKEKSWETLLGIDLRDFLFSPSELEYVDEVIGRKRILYLENPYEVIHSWFSKLDDLSDQENEYDLLLQLEAPGFLLPLLSGKKVFGALLLWGTDIQEQDLPAFSLFASQIGVALENVRLLSWIQQLAITDELTGLHNRRGLFEIGRMEIERTRRYKLPLAAILMDIDHFKRVNDRFSHSIGDQVLQSFAECIQNNTRELDVISRIGGEEFVILLPGSNHKSAQETADRLQRIIAEHITSTNMGDITITVSQGVAVLNENMTDLYELIQAADEALYMAKESGRNRVVSSLDFLQK